MQLNQRLRARTPNLGEGRMYWDVVITDYLREGDSYLLFKTESAKGIIQFKVEKEGHYEVKLRHCFTTSGSPSCIAQRGGRSQSVLDCFGKTSDTDDASSRWCSSRDWIVAEFWLEISKPPHSITLNWPLSTVRPASTPTWHVNPGADISFCSLLSQASNSDYSMPLKRYPEGHRQWKRRTINI